jgi:hypothetical protein
MKQDKGRVKVQVERQRVRQEWWWKDKEGDTVRAKRERESIGDKGETIEGMK